jgi:hypothetical protein
MRTAEQGKGIGATPQGTKGSGFKPEKRDVVNTDASVNGAPVQRSRPLQAASTSRSASWRPRRNNLRSLPAHYCSSSCSVFVLVSV